MKKTDEMDRIIQLRPEQLGYRITLLILGLWTLFNCWQTLWNQAPYQPLPGLIFTFAVCVQSFSQMALKQKMTAGDEEYQAPNTLLWTIIGAVLIAAAGLFLGTALIMRAQSL